MLAPSLVALTAADATAQATTVLVLVGAAIGALFAVGRLVRALYLAVAKMVRLSDAVLGTPGTDHKGLLVDVQEMRGVLDEVRKQVYPNGGSSIADAVKDMGTQLAALDTKQQALVGQQADLVVATLHKGERLDDLATTVQGLADAMANRRR